MNMVHQVISSDHCLYSSHICSLRDPNADPDRCCCRHIITTDTPWLRWAALSSSPPYGEERDQAGVTQHRRDSVAARSLSSHHLWCSVTGDLVTMSEFYDSTEDLEGQVCDVYDESRPRWYSSLRDKPEETKPAWSLARKKDSPSVRTYAEGGSLATARQRPREPCAKRQWVTSDLLLHVLTIRNLNLVFLRWIP